MRIAFIGGGNMGEAMLSSILNKGLCTHKDVVVSDVNEARRQYLEQKYQIAVTNDNRAAVGKSDIIILAIKPQNLTTVMAELFGRLEPTQLVLSIVAGAKVNSMRVGLNHRRIVRSMPNTPAQIGEGVSVWTATDEVTSEQKGWVSAILGTMGKEIYVDDEKYLDMATAISGGGPAYFFLFVESLVDAATRIGLPREMAQELVLQTMLGAAHLIQKSGKSPAELRRLVTSPGGTTAEAIAHLEKGRLGELVAKAVTAAYNKAIKLGS